MFRYVIVGMIGLVVIGGDALAQQSPSDSEAMEEALPGDHWTYETRDEITGEVKGTFTNVVMEVTPTAISVRTGMLGNPNSGQLIFDRSWNVTNNGTWKYAPHDGTGIRAPLAVGKTWTIQSSDVNSTQGVSFRRSVTAKVAARETVTTRAGTFETFKVEASITTRNANDPTKKFDGTMLMWYAPAIDHWVKRVYTLRFEGHLRENSTAELVEYGRR
jgi:hypothetical protein